MHHPLAAAVDQNGDAVIGDGDHHVFELTDGSVAPAALPFGQLRDLIDIAVGTDRAVYFADEGRLWKLAAGTPLRVRYPSTTTSRWPGIDTAGDIFFTDANHKLVYDLRARQYGTHCGRRLERGSRRVILGQQILVGVCVGVLA